MSLCVSESGLAFGEKAQGYDRARPSYPKELIDDLVGLAGPAARAVDVGCGTGKATVLLAGKGLVGVGVEPDVRMAAVARRNLLRYPNWRVDVATFEQWTPLSGEDLFDLVCSAQAWHWLDPEVRLERAAAALRPGGWVAAWWNHRDQDRSPLRLAMEAVYDRLAPQMNEPPTALVVGEGSRVIAAQARFGDAIQRDYHWSHPYTAAQWGEFIWAYSESWDLTPEQLDEVVAALCVVIDAHGGVYNHRFVCRTWLAQKS